MADIVELLRDEATKVIIDRARGLDVSSKDVTGSVIWKAAAEIERFRAAVEGIADDYMTSDIHHPGWVLIPQLKFDAICAAFGTEREGK